MVRNVHESDNGGIVSSVSPSQLKGRLQDQSLPKASRIGLSDRSSLCMPLTIPIPWTILMSPFHLCSSALLRLRLHHFLHFDLWHRCASTSQVC